MKPNEQLKKIFADLFDEKYTGYDQDAKVESDEIEEAFTQWNNLVHN